MVEKIKRQYGDDSSRWRREMLAEYSEDEDVWLSQSLIVNCIESELVPYKFESAPPQSEYYGGIDFGQKQDYSVITVIEKQKALLRAIHVHRFPWKQSIAVSSATPRAYRTVGMTSAPSMLTIQGSESQPWKTWSQQASKE